MPFDLISIGDTVIDTFVPLKDAEVINKEGVGHLALPFGYKIPIEEPLSFVGGNASNNAVGSARLGLKTAIYTNVGKKDDDEADYRIVEKLKKEGVDTRYIVHNPEFPTNHNIILNFKGERTILVHHHHWKYDLPDLDSGKWVYLTSLAPNFADTNLINQILNYLERTKARLAYQPGTFQISLGIKKNSRLLSAADFLIMNLEEAKKFLGLADKKTDIKKLLEKLSDTGVRKVVITDGSRGSYGYDGNKFFKLESFPAEVVQKTGAGDAYATAVVAGLIHGENLEEAMRWGACNSASVVSAMGPQEGLLSLNQMREKLKENSKITTKEI